MIARGSPNLPSVCITATRNHMIEVVFLIFYIIYVVEHLFLREYQLYPRKNAREKTPYSEANNYAFR